MGYVSFLKRLKLRNNAVIAELQKALNNVSINFRDNEFVSILGPSGSGKSTLLNAVAGQKIAIISSIISPPPNISIIKR